MLRMTQDPNKEPTVIGGIIYQSVCLYRLAKYRYTGCIGKNVTKWQAVKMIMNGQVRRHWLIG